ncbi:MAG: virulence factor [Pseudomonadota bacterium]
MPDVTIVYWRDIPAQVIVGKGRRGTKVQLPERFEQAIDRCAMKVGAKDADAYLAEWRKAPPYAVEGDAQDVANAEAARLEAEYDSETIKFLIANDGRAATA